MSNLAEAELYAESTTRGGSAPPAEGSWDKRRAERKADAERKAAQRRKSVLDRIPEGGITRVRLAAKLARDLDSSWRAGTAGILEDIYQRDEAHEIEGVVFPGPGKRSTTSARLTSSSASPAGEAVWVSASARVLQVAKSQTWWHRRALLLAAHPIPLAEGAVAINELVASGELLEHPSGDGRVGLRPEPAQERPLPIPVARAAAPASGSSDQARESGTIEPRSGDDLVRRPGSGEESDGAIAGAAPAAEDLIGAAGEVVTGGTSPLGPGLSVTTSVGLTNPDGEAWSTGYPPESSPGPVPDVEDLATGEVVTGGGVETAAAPSAPMYGRPGSAPRRDQVVALVAAEPGITTRQIAERLGLHPDHANQLCRAAKLRRELERDPTAGGGRGVTFARWFPAAGALSPAQPSPPASAEESSIEEPATPPAAGIPGIPGIPSHPAQVAPRKEEEDHAGGDPVLRREAGPGGADPVAGGATGDDPGAAGDTHVDDLDPGALGRDGGDRTEPAERAEPSATAGPSEGPPVVEQGGASPDPLTGPGWTIRKWRRPHINAGLFRKCTAQQERIAELERRLASQTTRAERFVGDLEGVGDTLDRLGVPRKGDLSWRRGWLEGWLAPKGTGR